ncbi:hypothetical protein [Mesorhizobium sp. WSM4904]|uniref:hypothetical protein n=1 Tax=Mesorhizobium sp. WSM4904 TaxID=3038545 RepID=UPI0024186473|nr:hypothetical protein [Mesorhizobium sp. WSM4904]WFP61905.1 hypothetical protein QAZ47_26070 [Mesorhizobium sp. WSM4904]
MIIIREQQSGPSRTKHLPFGGKFLNRFLVLGTTLAIFGCQYFGPDQSTAFNGSESGKAALIDLKPGRTAHTRTAQAPAAAVSDNPHFGNATYICSPSGFGQQSHCFPRVTGPLSVQNS